MIINFKSLLISGIIFSALISACVRDSKSVGTKNDSHSQKNVPKITSDNPDSHQIVINKNTDSIENNTQTNIVPNTSSPEKSLSNKYPTISYKRIKIKDKKHLDSIKSQIKKSKLNETPYWRTIYALNRKELKFYRVGDTIVIPEQIHDDLLAYSIFPLEYPSVKEKKKAIVVSIKYQSYGCYEYGKLVRFASINSGKRPTSNPIGKYIIKWKQRYNTSYYDSTWIMPYTVNFMAIGIAFHQYQMPGFPASHGCLRQFEHDAEWMFKWADIGEKDPLTNKLIPRSGTPVFIIDAFDFKTKYKSWRYLNSNKDLTLELPKDPWALTEIK